MIKTDRALLPVKYALGVYKEMNGFPTHEDLTFMLIINLEEEGRIEQPFTAGDVWPFMKDGLGTIKDLQGFLDYVSNPVDCPSNFIETARTVLGKKVETQYRITKNPWSRSNV
jgi:hypothetical protein